MRLKKLLKYLKGLNETTYELYVIDKHYIDNITKEYYKYKIYELFKKREANDVIYISIYKNRKKLKEKNKCRKRYLQEL